MTPFADTLATVLLALAALFPIVNPIGNAPLFVSLTRGASRETRRVLARRIAINGLLLLMISMLAGTYILAFFGISLAAVQVGGGLVLTATGWSLLSREHADTTAAGGGERTDAALLRQSFYPLTLPLTVGPGSMSVAVALGANTMSSHNRWLELLSASIVAPAVIAVSIYLSYRSSEHLERWLGASAMSVFLRLSSFILLCIGVQILWNGVSGLWLSLPR